jgi:hypothetical protein
MKMDRAGNRSRIGGTLRAIFLLAEKTDFDKLKTTRIFHRGRKE